MASDTQPPESQASAPAHAPVTWRARLDDIVELMKEMSSQTDPQEMVKRYAARMRTLFPSDGFVSLSRRGLEYPFYRITRSTRFKDEIDPWRDAHKLPLLQGGLLGSLLYEGQPRLVTDFCPLPTDPGFEYIGGMRSFSAIPHYDGGVALNMMVQMSSRPNGFDEERFPDAVWLSNLFGRATNSLVLSRRLREALDTLDRELRIVSDIQRSLLPRALPVMEGVEVAASYQTSKWAGGDYYDFFNMRDGRYGILVADVSGHGTPAAVLMAILHAIAHQFPGPAQPPGRVLEHINRELCISYTNEPVMFVTAFYGIYNAATRELVYANAGHPSPLIRAARGGPSVAISNAESGIPLGIASEVSFINSSHTLASGEAIAFYTDGITEARDGVGPLYGEQRLAEVFSAANGNAASLLKAISDDVNNFTNNADPNDDRTLLVMTVS